jgi:PncC family amidohydrolase
MRMELNITLVRRIAAACKAHNLYLCTAESCTGGLLGHIITNFPGASDFYLCGQITYSNTAKIQWLQVPPETLEKYGAVSKQTVTAMAKGIRAAFSHSVPIEKLVGISISGIAGPSGGSTEKPVGTVWIGIDMPGHQETHGFLFTGDRTSIKEQSAQAALELLLQALST